jgi:spermidine synthase
MYSIQTSGKRLLPASLILMGLTSVTVQVIFMRELLVNFFGNELSLGTLLGVWLLWTALGSGVLARFIHDRTPRRSFAWIQLALALTLPPSLILVRTVKSFLGLTFGELVGYIPMLIMTLAAMAPFCLLSGILYTLGCRAVSRSIRSGDRAIGRVYLLEAAGAALGGLLASFLFIRLLPPVYTLIILSLLNLLSALLLGNINPFRSRLLRVSWVIFVPIVIVTAHLALAPKWRQFSRQLQWKGYELITSKDTIYGNITLTRIGSQISFFENGLLMFTVPDRLDAEESVHFALLEHPSPERVLLVSGGLGGAVGEILRHPSVLSLDYVELDPELVKLAERYLPLEPENPLKDPRVTLLYTDARRFIKVLNNHYDLIIINLANPYTAQINRFYTYEFFQEVSRILAPGGVLSLKLGASENAIGPEMSRFLSTIWTTLGAAFPDRVALPGETARFLASNRTGLLTEDPQVLIQRLKERHLNTRYVREYRLPYDLNAERRAYLNSNLQTVSDRELNRDFKPVGYFFNAILWATTYSRPFKKLFLAFSRISPGVLALFGMLPALLILGITRLRRRPYRTLNAGLLYSVLCIGFTEISLEVILLLGFQVLYGHVYQQMAMIVAGYMIGLALGSRAANTLKPVRRNPFVFFRNIQLFMALYPLAIAALFRLFQTAGYTLHAGWLSVIFSLMAMLSGVLGGVQFPLANRLYLLSGHSLNRTAGFLYSFDLLGSSGGAFLTSALLIPIFGIPITLGLLTFANLCAYGFLMTLPAGSVPSR